MAPVTVTLSGTAAERAAELASERGVSTDEFVSQLVLAAPTVSPRADDATNALAALFGCGTGKATSPAAPLADLRRNLAGRKLAAGTETL